MLYQLSRAVARSENPGGHVILGGDNVPPQVEIGLTDRPKTEDVRAPPAPACDRPEYVVNGLGSVKLSGFLLSRKLFTPA